METMNESKKISVLEGKLDWCADLFDRLSVTHAELHSNKKAMCSECRLIKNAKRYLHGKR